MNKKSQVCRTCLSETDESIFQVIIYNDIEIPLIVMLSECIGIEVSEEDEISLYICDNCTDQIISSYIFRKKCLASEKKLLKGLRLKFGKEPVDKSDAHNTVAFREIVNDDLEDDRFSPISDRDPLETDWVKEFKNSELRHECPTCKRRFKRHYNMKRHIMQVHEPPEIEKRDVDVSYLFLCDFCDHEFVSKDHLKKHLLIHMSEKDEQNGGSLSNDNVTETELNKDLPHECPHCSKCFRRRYNLKRHMETHEPPVNRIRVKRKAYMFICVYCSKKFKSRESLRKHKIIHNVENQLVDTKFTRRQYVEHYVRHLHKAESKTNAL